MHAESRTNTILCKYFEILLGEGTIFRFSDKGEQRRGVLYHIFYQIQNAFLFAPGMAFLSAYCGTFVLRPIFDTAFVIELGKNISIPVPYLVNK